MKKILFQTHLMTRKLFFVLICSLALSSCSHKFSIYHSNKLLMGMSINEVNSLVTEPLSAGDPIAEFDISIKEMSSHKYFVQVYNCVYAEDQVSDYFIVFEDGKLKYWGFPYEFSRHYDVVINKIGIEAVNEYKKVK